MTVRFLVGGPAKENVARRLHRALAFDDPLALVAQILWRRYNPFEGRCLRFLDLQEHVILIRRHEEPDGAKCSNAADANNLDGYIGERIPFDEIAPLRQERAAVARKNRGWIDRAEAASFHIEMIDQRRAVLDMGAAAIGCCEMGKIIVRLQIFFCLYQGCKDPLSELRIIDPLGLVAKAGIWYLVARSGNEMRTFRAERILGVTETDEHFTRPDGFDLVGLWRQWTIDFEDRLPAFPVIVRVPRDEAREIGSYWEAQLLDDGSRSGTALVKVIFPSESAAVHQIIAWGEKSDIVEPDVLRAQVVARAHEVIAHHGRLNVR